MSDRYWPTKFYKKFSGLGEPGGGGNANPLPTSVGGSHDI